MNEKMNNYICAYAEVFFNNYWISNNFSFCINERKFYTNEHIYCIPEEGCPIIWLSISSIFRVFRQFFSSSRGKHGIIRNKIFSPCSPWKFVHSSEMFLYIQTESNGSKRNHLLTNSALLVLYLICITLLDTSTNLSHKSQISELYDRRI